MPQITNQIPGPSMTENSRIVYQQPGAEAVDLAYQEGTPSVTLEEADTGCNQTGGFTTQAGKRMRFEMDLKAQYDVENNPLTPGGTLVNAPVLTLGENGSFTIWPDFDNLPGEFYFLPVSWIGNLAMSMQATENNPITYSFKLKNQGPFGYPGNPFEED